MNSDLLRLNHFFTEYAGEKSREAWQVWCGNSPSSREFYNKADAIAALHARYDALDLMSRESHTIKDGMLRFAAIVDVASGTISEHIRVDALYALSKG